MKENIRFLIVAILLSAGAVAAPYSVGSMITCNAKGIRQTVYHRPQHYALSPQVDDEQRNHKAEGRQFVDVSMFGKAKSPALLWHRFSFTPHPEFIHWIIKLCRYRVAFILLAL